MFFFFFHCEQLKLIKFLQAIGKTIGAQIQDASKKVTKKITTNATVKTVTQQPTSTLKSIANNKVVQPQTDDLAKPKQASRVKTQLKKDDEDKKEISNKTVNNLRRSVDLEKSDESSLYVSALESLPEESNRRLSRSQKVSRCFKNLTRVLK